MHTIKKKSKQYSELEALQLQFERDHKKKMREEALERANALKTRTGKLPISKNNLSNPQKRALTILVACGELRLYRWQVYGGELSGYCVAGWPYEENVKPTQRLGFTEDTAQKLESFEYLEIKGDVLTPTIEAFEWAKDYWSRHDFSHLDRLLHTKPSLAKKLASKLPIRRQPNGKRP